MIDSYEIAVLAENYENKALRCRYLAATNCYGLSPEDQMKLNIEVHQAEAEMFQAWRKLTEAKTRP